MEVSALTHAGVAGLNGRSPLLRLQSDERLITLVRRGNHGAFEELVRRYQSRLLSFCRHMLGSREDAEDVLQEVFAASFNAILADDRAINVRPWLYRIARNRSLNHLRRVQAIGVDSMDIHFAEHGTTTADKVDSREAFRELIVDVGDLPETQRTALLLREIDALSYEQIAEAMETTIPSVKSLLVRARVSLAEAAEARRLSCEDVRFELGEVAEGLRRRTSPPVRRHLRDCERCGAFRIELRASTKALAMALPVGPLLVAKKLLLAHLGFSFGAGGAGGTASGGAAIGAAAVGSTTTGGLISAGLGAVATKAAVGLAAAALVTASAVEIEQRTPPRAHPQAVAQAPAAVVPHSQATIVQRTTAAPVAPTHAKPVHRAAKDPTADAAKPVTDAPTATTPAPTPVATDPGRTQSESSTTSLPVSLPQSTTVAAAPITAVVSAPSDPTTTTVASPPPTTTTPPPTATTPTPPPPPVVVTPPVPPTPQPPAEPPVGDEGPPSGGSVSSPPVVPAPEATPAPAD